MVKKTGRVLEFLSEKVVKIILLGISAILAFWSVRYTYSYPLDYSNERATIAPDSIGGNLVFFLGILVAFYMLQKLLLRGEESVVQKKIYIFALTTVAVVGIILFWYVSNSHIPPYWDQAQVFFDALSFKEGDYSDMKAYLGMYPQQYGLVFLYELIFLVMPDEYISIQYVNVLFVLVIIFFSYRLADELFHNQVVNLYCILGTVAFLPMFLYVNFVYGDVGFTALAIVGNYFVLRWRNENKVRYALWSVVSFAFAYLLRKNILIVLLGVLIVLAIDAWKRMSLQSLVVGVMILLIPMLSMSAVKVSYEMRSGQKVSEGIPAIMWIAMGMQESYNGCGVFNGYSESTYRGEAASDTDSAIRIAKGDIENRLEEFRNDASMTIDFYKAKLQGQWIEPTFSSLMETSKDKGEPTAVVKVLYHGEMQSRILGFMDYYNSVIYIGVFLFVVHALLKKDDILSLSLPVAIIGGFLFSILWEAKGRYVMPYVVFMLPFMAQGLYVPQVIVKKVLQKCLLRPVKFLGKS